MSIYYEGFAENFQLGYRVRVYDHGEGSVGLEYQDWVTETHTWENREFIGIPIDLLDDVIAILNTITKLNEWD